ncbi:16S rRNA (adenine(1518)-N(6)/adenine(1519)-N(6))-dimethyltransferase RsmA [Salisaeta longa]|uniref:16S rRNA (adenine(1518)-N(6)/adenine(1519)-N(6))- dimethyltransferase RsmA n=1 Tax=Salisaeta longa TaxID=503170 RepID=UPI00040B80A2|nr:16S rRNA (adenine(1518)-N(6)/adenine(1519)-N(6))-dimethyltransferase RsmA [Salisaeta longa]
MSRRVPFRPKQSLGQNFMRDPNTIRKLIDTLQAAPEDPVVEVGAGTGALTEGLAARYPQFTAIEIDERAVAVLREKLPDLPIRQEDLRETPWEALAAEAGAPLHIISNTPYYLTSELLFALLEAEGAVAEAVLTMQKAVADRLVAAPRTKAYGILSVLVQLFATPTEAFTISRHVFYPQPDITSAAVHIRFDSDARPPDLTLDDVRPVVRAAFNQRRKMLRNSLHAWTKDRGLTLPNDWGRRRAEALTPDEFATLARYLNSHTA